MLGSRRFALMVGLTCLLPARVSAADLPTPSPASSAAVLRAEGAPVAGNVPTTLAPTMSMPCPECLTVRCPGDPVRWWASVDYTFGWINGVSAPALLTATPVGSTTSTVLVGGGELNGGFRNGFQLRGGFWINDSKTCGIEAGVLFLGGLAERSSFGDTPGSVIGRPFINALTNSPETQIVSVPGLVSGRASIDAVSSDFWGADVAFRKLICCDCNGRLDWLLGYRFLSYGDALTITEDLSPTTAVFPPGTRIGVTDSFTAQNQFHGLLIALGGEYRMGSWFISGRGGFSFGGTFREATVSGSTTVEVPPSPSLTVPGGLLALSSNSGTYKASDWVFVPEASVRIGCQVTDNLRLYVGYSFLYWPGVYRAGDQIDPVVNPGLLPPSVSPLTGQVRPLFPDRQSSLWFNAISLGMELRY